MLRASRLCSPDYLAGILDHGLLLGLTDDDHPDYWGDTTYGARTGDYWTTGHIAIGADSSISASVVFDLDETLTTVDDAGYAALWQVGLTPAGVLSEDTVLIGINAQAAWTGAVDGGTYAYMQGLKGEGVNLSETHNVKGITGVYGKANNLKDTDVTDAIAGLFLVSNDDALDEEDGDITNAYSLLARAYTDKTTGTIATRYGLYIEDTTGGGNLTNQYAIYCPALTGADTDNLFIKNISANSDFGSGDLTTTGSYTAGTLTVSDGSIVDTDGTIDFTATNLTTTGSYTAGTLTVADGSIEDSDGTIDFGSTELTTTGHVGFGQAPLDSRSLTVYEVFTHQSGGKYSTVADAFWTPAGALGATANAIGLLAQGQWFESTVDGSTHGSVYGIIGNAITAQVDSAGDLKLLLGIWGRARHRSEADVTTAIGVKGDVFNDDSGSSLGDITSAYSFLASCDADKTTGVITTRYGLYIEDVATANYTTDQYGIYCPALAAATDDNYFIKNISAPSDFGSGTILTSGAFTLTGCSVLGLNSAVFQPATDSTTFGQFLDAAGNPVVTVDTVNKRVRIGPGNSLEHSFEVKSANTVGTGGIKIINTTSYSCNLLFENADGSGAFELDTAENMIFRTSQSSMYFDNRGTTGSLYYRTGGESPTTRLRIDKDGNINANLGQLYLKQSNGFFGIGEPAPETLLELTHTTPIIQQQVSTYTNADDARKSIWRAKGNKTDETEHTLGQFSFSHDGTGDDYYAKYALSLNKNAGADTLSDILTATQDSFVIQAPNDSTTFGQWLDAAGASILNLDSTNRFIGVNIVDPDARMEIYTGADATVGLHIKSTASQSANLFNITDVNDVVMVSVDSGGNLYTAVGGSVQTCLLDFIERAADPTEPPDGVGYMWMCNGTSDQTNVADGDIVIAVNAGGNTKVTILHDHSTAGAWV